MVGGGVVSVGVGLGGGVVSVGVGDGDPVSVGVGVGGGVVSVGVGVGVSVTVGVGDGQSPDRPPAFTVTDPGSIGTSVAPTGHVTVTDWFSVGSV